jgi:hypothetical protein
MKLRPMMKVLRRFAVLLLAVASTTPAALRAQELSLSGSGAGLWAQHGRPKFRVNRIAVNGSGKNAKIEFVLTNGAKRSLEGKASGQGESSFFWKISRAGNSKAQGSVWIGTKTSDEVSAAYASGTIEGQPFLAQFNAIPTVRLNFLTEGSGAWARADGKGDELKLSGFGLMSDIQAKASAVFFLADGSHRRFTGRVKKRITKPRAVIVALQNAGEANASGELRVRFTEQNHIVSVTGPGKLDGQPFKINFEAALEAAERAEVFEEKLGTLVEAKGKVAKGDSNTQFTAWSDNTGVRYVEALVDQGDYGSSHRKLFYESGKLVFFSEKGQVRDTSSKAQGRMNLVETSISFSSLGKVEAASKMLNGKPAKLTPYDAPSVVEYAEMVRKAAEESKRTR